MTRDVPLFDIGDFTKLESLIKPQQQEDGKALHPDCAFIFARSDTYFLTINVALDTEGYYHYGYGLYENEGGNSCYPSAHRRDHKKALTLRGCLLNALNHIRRMSKYCSAPSYPLYVRTATDAIRRVNEASVIQLSIFDFMD